MKNFRIDVLSGNIFFDNLRILPSDEDEFLLVARSLFPKVSKYPADVNLTAYSNDQLMYGAYAFEAHVWFGNRMLEMLSLDWLGGITQEKGWNSSNSDLIKDKSSLTRFIQKISSKKPDQKEEFKDIFTFGWGSIASVGVRREMYSKIDITWNHNN